MNFGTTHTKYPFPDELYTYFAKHKGKYHKMHKNTVCDH